MCCCQIGNIIPNDMKLIERHFFHKGYSTVWDETDVVCVELIEIFSYYLLEMSFPIPIIKDFTYS